MAERALDPLIALARAVHQRMVVEFLPAVSELTLFPLRTATVFVTANALEFVPKGTIDRRVEMRKSAHVLGVMVVRTVLAVMVVGVRTGNRLVLHDVEVSIFSLMVEQFEVDLGV